MEVLSTTKIEVIDKYFGSKNEAGFGQVEWSDRSVFVNGELIYREAMTPEIDKYSNSGLKRFLHWLSGQKKGGNCCNVSQNCSKSFCFFRKGLLQTFNFKLQLFKARFNQKLLGCKATHSLKVKSIEP